MTDDDIMHARTRSHTCVHSHENTRQRVGPHLGCNRVGARGKQLGNAGSLEASLHEAKGGPQSCPPSSNHHRIIRVVNHRVVTSNLGEGPRGGGGRERMSGSGRTTVI